MGTRMRVHRYGNPHERPVVLVHGFTEAGTAWPDLVLRWEARWNIHAPDLRGHDGGDAAAPPCSSVGAP